MRSLYILAALLSLPACSYSAGSSGSSNGVQVALKEQVAICRYVGDVHGTSSHYGWFAAAGVENSREEAMDKAREMGATHIVWGATTTGFGGTAINGDAFACPAQETK